MAVKFTIDPVPEPKPAKSIFKSKTFWVNLISFGLAIIPEVQAFAEGTLSPENGAVVTALCVQATNILNVVLRVFTKGPVTRRLAMLRTGMNVFLGRGIK